MEKRFTKGSEEHKAFMREIGRRGGQRNVEKNGREHMARIGYKGGQSLLRTRGKEFLSHIGKIGSHKQWHGEDEA